MRFRCSFAVLDELSCWPAHDFTGLKYVALRLQPGQELKEQLRKGAVGGRNMFVLSCVGSITSVGLRMAGFTASDKDNVTGTSKTLRLYDAHYEIVSLVGSICNDGLHLHISMSDSEGRVLGGHLLYA